jgi:hypothetical protein
MFRTRIQARTMCRWMAMQVRSATHCERDTFSAARQSLTNELRWSWQQPFCPSAPATDPSVFRRRKRRKKASTSTGRDKFERLRLEHFTSRYLVTLRTESGWADTGKNPISCVVYSSVET